MTEEQRDDCLYRILRAMRMAREVKRFDVYELQRIGENVISSYRDLDYGQQITAIQIAMGD